MRNMPFIQLVGDLPVYALIVQLKNENVDCFQRILPVNGAFHAQCSFIAAINKRFGGSGLSDILSAAGVIAEKSVDQALRGKHYSRACRALQLVYETLQRRILRYGLSEGVFISEDLKKIVKLIADGNLPNESKEALVLELQQNNQLCTIIDQTYKIIVKMKSPMANFWLSFMNMVEILIMNIHSCRTQNWNLFKSSIRLMLPWLIIYDQNKYGKWLVEYWVEMSCLPGETSKFMEDGLFAQSITGKSYSCLPLDLWI